jgi:hypothetical protein
VAGILLQLHVLNRRDMPHAERVVRATLARLIRENKLDNDPDARPRGYGVVGGS